METKIRKSITVESNINAPVAKAWKAFTSCEDVKQWNNASDDWYTPHAENDLRKGGKFTYRMSARDNSMSFDFSGIYDLVKINEALEYTLDDGRKVQVYFTSDGTQTKVTETFEAEEQNSLELQQFGWQAILDNFKKHVEQK